MRNHSFVAGEFYHVYSHSVGNASLFQSKRDYERFLSTMFCANGKRNISHLDRFPGLNLVSDIKNGKIDIGDALVDIIGFCIMPNHFHLLLGERTDGNISKFLHRILVSYSKYFNLKYEKRGHVFERTFNSKHLSDDNYFLRALAYLHLNSKDMKGWRKKEHRYDWSSLQDYVKENRWGKLLKIDIALEYFDGNQAAYKAFVEEARSEMADYKLTET